MTTRVLITNDDGIAAPGLRWLAGAAVDAGLDVVVAAPADEASGASASLSAVYADSRLAVTKADIAGVDVTAYSVAASPSYIVVLAGLGTFGAVPSLVLSGINRGANAGYAILHSGTVGATLTGANQGIRGLAVSLDVLPPAGADPSTGGASLAAHLAALDNEALHWATAAQLARKLIPQACELPEGMILNLNVPNRAPDDLAGVRLATLAPFGQVSMAVAERGEGYIRTSIKQGDDERVEGSDIALLADGYATVTPVRSIRDVPDVSLDL